VIYLVYALHIAVCIFLILVVLLQQGKGADLSVFGGGNTQTAFGARGAATVLHKLTVICFVLFICTTLGIAILKGGGASATVMSEVEENRAAAEQEAQPTESESAPEAVEEPTTDAATESVDAPPAEAAEGAADDDGGEEQ